MKTTHGIRVLVWGVAVALAGVTAAQADTHASVSIGVGLPHGYAQVRVGKDRYYTHRGTFYRPGPHGGYVVVRAPRGAVLRELPPRYVRIYVGSTVYYRYGDVYYQPVAGGYVVVDPPAMVVTAPPPPPPTAPTPAPAVTVPAAEEYQPVWVGQTEFLFRDGQFFRRTPDGLVWVEAPLGALTKTLPADARSVWYQDNEYFECDNVFFRKTPDGYKVVAAPWKS